MGTLRFVLTRFAAQRLLGVAVVVTLAFCIGVMVAGPIYANGAREAISSSAIDSAPVTVRNARLTVYGNEGFGWAQADDDIHAAFSDVPVDAVVAQGLSTVRVGGRAGPSVPLLFREGAADHLELRGTAPGPGEVLVQDGAASSQHLNIGDAIEVLGPTDERTTLTVSGIYRAPGQGDTFWFGSRTPFPPPDSLEPFPLVVSPATGLAATKDLALNTQFTWDLYLGLGRLDYHDTAAVPEGLAGGMDRLHANPDLAQLRLSTGLDTLLELVRQRVANLFVPIMLVAFQIGAVALAVLAGVGALALSRQSFELAVLHSRGFSQRTLLGAQAASAILIGAIAYPVGLAIGLALTAIASATNGEGLASRGFPLTLTGGALLLGVATAAIGVAILILLSLPAVRRTVLEERRALSREERPLLARVPVELVVLPVGIFAFVQLRSGGAADPTTGTIDPLVLLAPTLLLMGFAFLLLRLLLVILRAMDHRIGRTRRLSTYLVGRRLGRAPGTGFAAALLLLLAFGLLFVSTSYRAIVVRNHDDAAHQQIGADWIVSVTPPKDILAAIHRLPPGTSPVLRTTPGIEGASLALPPTAFAVDPATFADTAWWRSDYADRPLGDIVGDLATPRLGVPVPGGGGDLTATVSMPRAGAGLRLSATFSTEAGSVRTSYSPPLSEGTSAVDLPMEDATRLLSLAFEQPEGADLPTTLQVDIARPAIGGAALALDGWDVSSWLGSSGSIEPRGDGIRFRFSPGVGTVVAAITPPDQPLPALVSNDLLSAGGTFEVRIGGQRLPVRVVAGASSFPSTVPNSPFLVVSLDGLLDRELRIPEPSVGVNEVWSDDDASPVGAIQRARFATGDVRSTAPIEAFLAQLPQTLAVGMNVTAAAGGLALVIVGVAAGLSFSQRRRDYEFAALRAMGTQPRQLRRAVVLEQFVLLGYAIVAGGLVAYALLRLVMPSVGTSLGVRYPTPVLVIDWPLLLAAVVTILVVSAIGTALAMRATLGSSITGVLRGEAE